MDDLDKIGKLYAIKDDSYTANRGKYFFKLEEIVLYLKRERSTNSLRDFNYYF